MSNFVDITTTKITKEIGFGQAATGARSYMTCKDGEIAGWGYDHTDDDGNDVINIYNRSTGKDVLIATVYVMAGCDIFRGLFSSGAVPNAKVTDSSVIYYRVDY